MCPASLEDSVYARMRWNTPLSVEHATLLLDRMDIRPGGSVLDLGCGWGELLLRAVAAGAMADSEGNTGLGIDKNPALLERGRALAVQRGLEGRVAFECTAAETSGHAADRTICIGAAHAWGGAARALSRLAQSVGPGGRLLFGEGCWEQPPSREASKLFGSGVLALPALIDRAIASGWHVLHMSTADQREWDEFESSWRAGRQEWLAANPDDDRAQAIQSECNAQLREYINVYRGVLGFCYLVLTR
jgi:cyclopropane fatty-acyl-phospholipid synthase-like methyltransferase